MSRTIITIELHDSGKYTVTTHHPSGGIANRPLRPGEQLVFDVLRDSMANSWVINDDSSVTDLKWG